MHVHTSVFEIDLLDNIVNNRKKKIFLSFAFYIIYLICTGVKDIGDFTDKFIIIIIYLKPYQVNDIIYSVGERRKLVAVNI